MAIVVGKPDKSGVMSEPVTVKVPVAELLARLGSFDAAVVPVSAAAPIVVGVPETVHVMTPAGATVAGGVGEHEVLNPEGRPLTAHDALVAAIAGAAAFEQVKVPVYGTPMLPVAGSPAKLMLISEPTVAMACVAVLLPPLPVPPLVSLVAPVLTVAVVVPEAVGVPLTGQLMLAPATTVAGGSGEHAPTVTPGGRPLTAQVAFVALAVAAAAFVHLIVPV